MKTNDVYAKTLKFVLLKLALGGAVLGVGLIIGLIFILIGNAIDNELASYILVLVWLVLVVSCDNLLTHYFGYLIKAGHIAVVTEYVTTGNLPANQVEYAFNTVKSRFATSSVYFLIDKLVSGAVKELQEGVDFIGGKLDFIPYMDKITSFIKIFIGIALGYIDECCLGYTFFMKDQSAFKSACDGLTIYWKNKKKLLKDSLFTTLIVMALTSAAWLVSFLFVLVIALATGSNIAIFVSIIVAILIAGIIKTSFIDSWMMVKMMICYMEDAPSTSVENGMYDTLCKISGKFKQLFEKAKTSVA
jgi:uncharacterized membrane protein YbhN (UPF0104 family)